ncbi:transferrin-binding protein-like solute binding protein [Glaesserella parasuis]|uniref:factor H binding protein domain-containing protein n=1 Tax=Glaesserella parasuis TaxID=738 RepID=UPI0024368696|nr:factor H binding protein domain-containing protein [Glaesserella parasuis]MDG6368934.1 transferrin-binding protein-like solute binding protein [Glaesserella parasuis]MDG6843749.1 transferrin-binding protein-like solute binding protein [Glaesserella parasuis]MDO9804788.1 transferrin-binding protein-like solute binding protein [Glaesserella parasuis]MDO9991858.1 transferrin-binding protein-like solute binding protein [Glaesserella parasuis]MDP0099828.1 transferrin-binding protein-like solute 
MSLKKVTLASLILLGLTACGSSGGGSSDSTVNRNTSQTAEQQAQADKLAAEKAEAERLATEKAKEAEVASSQSALAKEELARLNKEKAEAEKLAAEAQAKAEQALKEKAEAEKLSAAAKTQLDNAIKNKTIAEKAAADAKIALDNAVKAKAEAESLTAQAIEAKKQADETLKTIQEQIPVANSEKEKALAAQEQANQNLKEAQAQLIQATADKDAAIRAAAEAKATLADANKQKEEALRLATEANDAKKAAEAEKDNAMKLAQEAKIKAEEERLAAEKARQEKLASFIAIAKQAGLTDEEATQVAQDNLNGTLEQLPKVIEVFKAKKIAEEQARLQREIDSAKGFSEDAYQQGFNHLNYSASSSASNSCVNFVCTSWNGTTTTGETLYNQKYSVVSGDYSARQGRLNGSWIDESSFSNIQIKGLKTQENAVPNEGSAIYLGKAFKGQTAGELTYNVNFATRIGSGSISGLPVGQVTLGEANINGTALSGKANSNGNYRLEFFGPNAEEIGGKMSLDGNNYGLAGTRGEIQK